MSKFKLGENVLVLANTLSNYIPDHQEKPWTGMVQGVYNTSTDFGITISYNIVSNNGNLARNVLENRLKIHH